VRDSTFDAVEIARAPSPRVSVAPL
jgi:hypothetical protein